MRRTCLVAGIHTAIQPQATIHRSQLSDSVRYFGDWSRRMATGQKPGIHVADATQLNHLVVLCCSKKVPVYTGLYRASFFFKMLNGTLSLPPQKGWNPAGNPERVFSRLVTRLTLLLTQTGLYKIHETPDAGGCRVVGITCDTTFDKTRRGVSNVCVVTMETCHPPAATEAAGVFYFLLVVATPDE